MRKSLVAVPAALLTVGLGGVAYAGSSAPPSPTDASGAIHGCWTNAQIGGSHVIVLQDSGTTCPRGTTAIAWNQTGAQGPAGLQGPAGPTSLAALQGSACTIPTSPGTPGFVNDGVAANGAINLNCTPDKLVGRVVGTAGATAFEIVLEDVTTSVSTVCRPNVQACGANAITVGDAVTIEFVATQTQPFTYSCRGLTLTSSSGGGSGQEGTCSDMYNGSPIESDANLL